MSLSLVALLLFGAFVCAAGAILLGVQRVILSRHTAEAAVSSSAATPFQLQRRPRPAIDHQSRGPVARFDRWFLQLVRDSGLAYDPVSACLLLILSGAGVAGVLFLWREQVLVSVLGLVAGMGIPVAYLTMRKHKRIKQLQEQLPPALDMLARCVRAGQSLDQALLSVGQQAPEPLAAEFRLCAKQLDLGLGMASVMRLLVERVRLHDVRIFTTTLTVHRQTGGNVAKVLERLAGVIRDRLSYRRQLRVATGAGKASAILVSLIGPLVFVFFFFFRPEYLETMLTSPLGQSALLVAVLLEIVGLVWTARLLRPTY